MSNHREISGRFRRNVASSVVLGAALVLGACSTRTFDEGQDDGGEQPIQGVESPVSIDGIEVKSDRLRFETSESVLTTLEALDAEALTGGDAVFEDFEKALGFRSLRSKVEKSIAARLEAGWNGEGRIDDEFVAWEALRAVLNEDRQIQIGDRILTLLDDETMLSTKLEDADALKKALASDPESARELGDVLDRATGKVLVPADSVKKPSATEEALPNVFTFQPDAESGQDAVVFSLSGQQDKNRGNDARFSGLVWSWSGVEGIQRSFVRFDLDSLPAGARVKKATLTLTGTPGAEDGGSHSTLSGSNAAWLRRVSAAWDENTITWQNQPAVSSEAINLPLNTNAGQPTDIDVTTFTQQMIDDGNDYGFMLQLQTEQKYRALVFHSSDATNPSVRPRLVIELEGQCGASFEASERERVVSFSPTVRGVAPFTYAWDFADGATESAAAPQHAYAKGGRYEACLVVTDADGCSTEPTCVEVKPSTLPDCCRFDEPAHAVVDYRGGNSKLVADLDLEYFFGARSIARSRNFTRSLRDAEPVWSAKSAETLSVILRDGKVRPWSDRAALCSAESIQVEQRSHRRAQSSTLQTATASLGEFRLGLEEEALSATFHAEAAQEVADLTLTLGASCAN